MLSQQLRKRKHQYHAFILFFIFIFFKEGKKKNS